MTRRFSLAACGLAALALAGCAPSADRVALPGAGSPGSLPVLHASMLLGLPTVLPSGDQGVPRLRLEVASSESGARTFTRSEVSPITGTSPQRVEFDCARLGLVRFRLLEAERVLAETTQPCDGSDGRTQYVYPVLTRLELEPIINPVKPGAAVRLGVRVHAGPWRIRPAHLHLEAHTAEVIGGELHADGDGFTYRLGTQHNDHGTLAPLRAHQRIALTVTGNVTLRGLASDQTAIGIDTLALASALSAETTLTVDAP